MELPARCVGVGGLRSRGVYFEYSFLVGEDRRSSNDARRSSFAADIGAGPALSAPGVITVVAVEEGSVVGFAQLLTDCAIRAYLADMVVVTRKRGSGIGRRLVQEVFARSTAAYIGLCGRKRGILVAHRP